MYFNISINILVWSVIVYVRRDLRHVVVIFWCRSLLCSLAHCAKNLTRNIFDCVKIRTHSCSTPVCQQELASSTWLTQDTQYFLPSLSPWPVKVRVEQILLIFIFTRSTQQRHQSACPYCWIKKTKKLRKLFKIIGQNFCNLLHF